MFRWAIIFAVIALVAALLGFGGIAGLRAVDRDHARLGADLDYRIGSAGVVSLSANQMLGNADGNPFSVSAGLHFKF